jgi:NADPH:quinone reductase-like Zn-dependent oxidoreductase
MGALNEVGRLAAAGLITAVTDHEVAFDDALDALARRRAGAARGKTIIRI